MFVILFILNVCHLLIYNILSSRTVILTILTYPQWPGDLVNVGTGLPQLIDIRNPLDTVAEDENCKISKSEFKNSHRTVAHWDLIKQIGGDAFDV